MPYIDVGAFVPLVTAAACQQYAQLRPALAVQSFFVALFAIAVIWKVQAMIWTMLGLIILTWVGLSTFYIDTKQTALSGEALALATGAIIISPIAYVTAWPVFTVHKYAWIFGRLMQLLHVLSVAGVAAALFAKPLLEGWGCYPPGTPLKDLSQGLCYKGSLACVLDDVNLNCKPNRTFADTYGGIISVAVNCQLAALHIWGSAFAWRFSQPDPVRP